MTNFKRPVNNSVSINTWVHWHSMDEYWLRCPSSVNRWSIEAKDRHTTTDAFSTLDLHYFSVKLYWFSRTEHVTLIFPKSIKILHVNTLLLSLWHRQFQVPPVCNLWDSVLFIVGDLQLCIIIFFCILFSCQLTAML